MTSEMPLEYQVCTLEQAKELAELLGEHAPGSLWVGVCYTSYADHPGYDVDMPRSCCDLILKTKIKSFRKQNDIEIHSITPAYTGDELGALLPNALIHGNEKYWRYAFAMHTKNRKTSVGYAKLSRYDHHFDAIKGLIKESKTEAQAKADLAIQGLKEGWIKKEDFQYPDFD